MNGSRIEFRRASSDDTQAIVDFHSNEALKNWEVEFHGFQKEDGVLYLALDDGKVIGTQGLIPYSMSIDGVPTLVHRSERTLVSSEYRGQGIFNSLYDRCKEFAAERDSAFVFGSTAAAKAFSRVGFRSEHSFSLHLVSCASLGGIGSFIESQKLGFGDLYNAVKSKNLWRGLEYVKLVASIPSLLLGILCSLLCLLKTAPVAFEQQVRSAGDLEELFAGIGVSGQLIYLEQAPEFIDWLEQVTPASERLFMYRGTALIGYAQYAKIDSHTLNVLDIVAENNFALLRLVGELKILAKQSGRNFVKTSFNVRCRALRRLLPGFICAGFLPVYLGGNEVLLPISKSLPDSFEKIESFYITEIWHALGSDNGQE